jgi:multiple sugar transport system permease protein
MSRSQSALRHPRTLQRGLSYAVLILTACVVALPIIWLLLTSLKKDTEYLTYPIHILPAVPQWANYLNVFNQSGFSFPKYAGQTLLLALTFTVLTTFTSAMVGFAFSRYQVPGRDRLFTIILALLILPGIVILIPQYILFARLHLTNTYWPWILWGLSGSPLHIFMFRQFFASFPKELEDAAEADGCGAFRIFLQIFLPNAKPVLATSFIFNFSGIWGDYFTPLIFLNDAKTTLGVKLATAFVDPQGHPFTTLTLAANVLYALPLVLLFFLGQKYILKGVVTSGLKG